MRRPYRILVLDDHVESGQFVRDAAEGMGMHCLATTSHLELLKYLTPKTSLVFLDLVMPEVDGIELLKILGERQCKANIILISGADRRILETAQEWASTLGLSVTGHLQKPFRLKELEAMIEANQKPHRPTV